MPGLRGRSRIPPRRGRNGAHPHHTTGQPHSFALFASEAREGRSPAAVPIKRTRCAATAAHGLQLRLLSRPRLRCGLRFLFSATPLFLVSIREAASSVGAAFTGSRRVVSLRSHDTDSTSYDYRNLLICLSWEVQDANRAGSHYSGNQIRSGRPASGIKAIGSRYSYNPTLVGTHPFPYVLSYEHADARVRVPRQGLF